MIISDLNYLEVVSDTNVVGASSRFGFSEFDFVSINFNTNNSFRTDVNSPRTFSNSASAGAKGVADNFTRFPTYSFTKADTLAVTDFLGSSFSASTSAAVINFAF